MRTTMVLAAIAILAFATVPAQAELTDFQKGVEAGLGSGFFMWNLSLAAQNNLEAAREYNANVNAFNNWLAVVFSNNETMTNMFRLSLLDFKETVAISDRSQSSIQRIGEYPADAYYTATGAGSKVNPQSTAVMGWV